jgi:hypothetical protein
VITPVLLITPLQNANRELESRFEAHVAKQDEIFENERQKIELRWQQHDEQRQHAQNLKFEPALAVRDCTNCGSPISL